MLLNNFWSLCALPRPSLHIVYGTILYFTHTCTCTCKGGERVNYPGGLGEVRGPLLSTPFRLVLLEILQTCDQGETESQ